METENIRTVALNNTKYSQLHRQLILKRTFINIYYSDKKYRLQNSDNCNLTSLSKKYFAIT